MCRIMQFLDLKWRLDDGEAVTRRARRKVEPNPQKDWIVRSQTHKALVDPELFDQAEHRLRQRRKPTRPTGRAVGASYLLSGLVVGLRCGSRVRGRRAVSGHRGKDNNRYITYSYVCGGYVRGGTKVCPSAACSRDVLEQAVREGLRDREARLISRAFRRSLEERIQAVIFRRSSRTKSARYRNG